MHDRRTQRLLDEAADQAATQAAAIVISGMRNALKLAIKDLLRDYRREFIEYLLTERWLRLLGGLLFVLAVLGLYFKEA